MRVALCANHVVAAHRLLGADVAGRAGGRVDFDIVFGRALFHGEFVG